jgi:hypothetical protein
MQERQESNQSNSPASSEGPNTPKNDAGSSVDNSPSKDEQAVADAQVASNSPNTRKNGQKYRRQLGPNGEPKKNFYNPPGKVMRHLAQQSYYDNFYGNQGQFYTLKQKYKTQMCKHFTENGNCPLAQYCQFAHGPSELRQSHDVSIPPPNNTVIATPQELRKDSTWSCALKLQDGALQKLERDRRVQVW